MDVDDDNARQRSWIWFGTAVLQSWATARLFVVMLERMDGERVMSLDIATAGMVIQRQNDCMGYQ